MGEVEVLVGCPHRLRAPISWRTKHPCPLCREAGFPGLWAIALTVDHRRPRRRGLADAAVSTLYVTGIPPAPPRPAFDARTYAERIRAAVNRAMDLSNRVPHPEVVQSIVIEPGALNVVMEPQNEADRRANVVRIQATQELRFRRRR